MLDDLIRRYNEAVFETDKAAAFAVAERALADGVSPEDIVFKIVVPALEEMMSAVTRDPDANLAQHFMTAQIASEVTERMLEKFRTPPTSAGRVIIGTSHGDLHSLFGWTCECPSSTGTMPSAPSGGWTAAAIR